LAEFARNAGIIGSPADIRAAALMTTIETVASVTGLGIARAAQLHGALRLDAGAFSFGGRRGVRRTQIICCCYEDNRCKAAMRHGDAPSSSGREFRIIRAKKKDSTFALRGYPL
jgi:hypothetical protein